MRILPTQVVLSVFLAGLISAEPVAVRYTEGTVHGFLSLRSADGKIRASGDLTQIVKGDRVTSHLVYRFMDGSIDDEICVFTQHETFKLISDRHIQKGPAFPMPTDTDINVGKGDVTVRYWEKGKEKVASEHMDLPPDLANGDLLNIVKNIPMDASVTVLPFVVPTPKPRLVNLKVTRSGEDEIKIAGVAQKALRLNVKVELGGVAGVIAPLIGKQPPDHYIWISRGELPTFVKAVGALSMEGTAWEIELSSPVWP